MLRWVWLQLVVAAKERAEDATIPNIRLAYEVPFRSLVATGTAPVVILSDSSEKEWVLYKWNHKSVDHEKGFVDASSLQCQRKWFSLFEERKTMH